MSDLNLLNSVEKYMCVYKEGDMIEKYEGMIKELYFYDNARCDNYLRYDDLILCGNFNNEKRYFIVLDTREIDLSTHYTLNFFTKMSMHFHVCCDYENYRNLLNGKKYDVVMVTDFRPMVNNRPIIRLEYLSNNYNF